MCAAPLTRTDVGLPSHRSLFEIQAQRIIRLQQVAHAAHPHGRCRASSLSLSAPLSLTLLAIVPWYIMTSPLTEAKTRKYFQEKNYFGLDPKNVIFFNQVRSAIHTDARQSTHQT